MKEGKCIMGEMRRDREETGEEMRADYETLLKMWREEKKKRQEAEEGLANALAINESHQKLNGKLQERLTEVEEENKKLHNTLNKKIDDVRKAGL